MPFHERYLNLLYQKFPGIKGKNEITITRDVITGFKVLKAWQYQYQHLAMMGTYPKGPILTFLLNYYHVEIFFKSEYGGKCVLQLDDDLLNRLDVLFID